MPYDRMEAFLQNIPREQAAKIKGMSQEAQQAALDAFNGCMYEEDNPSEEECVNAAVTAAMSASEGGKPRPRQGGAPAGGGPRGGGRRRPGNSNPGE